MKTRWQFLFLSLALSVLLFLLIPPLFPSIRLCIFAPFLILAYYKTSFKTCLVFSMGCGLFKDLYCSETRFGFYALLYTLTTLFLWKRRQNFFEDQTSTLPLMTFFFSVASSTLELLFQPLAARQIEVTFPLLLTDLLFLPLCDAFYAWLLFAVFLKWIYSFILKRQKRYGRFD